MCQQAAILLTQNEVKYLKNVVKPSWLGQLIVFSIKQVISKSFIQKLCQTNVLKNLQEKSPNFCKIDFKVHLRFGQFLMKYLKYLLLLYHFGKLRQWWFERIIVNLCTYNRLDRISKKPSSIF